MRKVLLILKDLLTYGAAFVTIVGFLFSILAPDRARVMFDALFDIGQSLSENTSDIVENTAGAKREVSVDPIIQLSNRGYNFSVSKFVEALINHDVLSVSLFCEAAPKNWLSSPSFIARANWGEEILDVTEGCEAINKDLICDIWNRDSWIFASSKTELTRQRFLQFCGQQLQTDIQRRIDAEERKAVAQYKEHCVTAREALTSKDLRYDGSYPITQHREDLARTLVNHLGQFSNPCMLNGVCWNTVQLENFRSEMLDRCDSLGIDLLNKMLDLGGGT